MQLYMILELNSSGISDKEHISQLRIAEYVGEIIRVVGRIRRLRECLCRDCVSDFRGRLRMQQNIPIQPASAFLYHEHRESLSAAQKVAVSLLAVAATPCWQHNRDSMYATTMVR